MIRLVLLFSLLFSSFCLGAPAEQRKKKAVFIIVDGIPADVIERVKTPALDEISAKGGYSRAYMGGEVGGVTQTPTVSAVCYNSLLTSTWGNKHNVWGNDIKEPNYHYWNIFRIARNQSREIKTGIFSSWEDNRTKLIGEGKPEAGALKMDYVLDNLEKDKNRFSPEKNSMHIFRIDEEISKEAANSIRTEAPDLSWVYLWFMDCAGHEHGDSAFFDEYTERADRQVARIWEAIQYREKYFNEDWMIVVTTDHGRHSSDGRGHGGQSERERTTWISTNVTPNDCFTRIRPAIVDIVPSLCRYLDMKVPANLSYEQEGVPFVGKVSLSGGKAEKKEGKIVLSWECLENGPMEIYYTTTNNFKEGKEDSWIKAGETQTGTGTFTFTPPSPETDFYKFSLRGTHNSIPIWVKNK